jgi:hypothetical protein
MEQYARAPLLFSTKRLICEIRSSVGGGADGQMHQKQQCLTSTARDRRRQMKNTGEPS